MNIWDSVQRNLEKASQEAARIARGQKLRSQIDGLSRQIQTQHSTLLQRTMELFTSGQLTQSQLLPLCQELSNLQQQLDRATHELKLLHSQNHPQQQPTTQTPIPPAMGTNTYPASPPYPANTDTPPTVLAPPPPPPSSTYQTYGGQTLAAPPPPGVEQPTLSSMETRPSSSLIPPPPPGVDQPTVPAFDTVPFQGVQLSKRCPKCNHEATAATTYCPNCGTALVEREVAEQPTVRGSTSEPFDIVNQQPLATSGTRTTPLEEDAPSTPLDIAEQETRRAEPEEHIADKETVRADPQPLHIADQETIRSSSSPSAELSEEKDGGR